MLWRADHDDFKANFSFAKTWNYLRDKRSDVTWRKIAFMVWYGLRLEIVYPHEIEWKVGGIDQCCILCGEKNETMDHMFFACLYSFTVWMNIAGRLIGSAITLDWNHTVASLMLPAHSRLDLCSRRWCSRQSSTLSVKNGTRGGMEVFGSRRRSSPELLINRLGIRYHLFAKSRIIR